MKFMTLSNRWYVVFIFLVTIINQIEAQFVESNSDAANPIKNGIKYPHNDYDPDILYKINAIGIKPEPNKTVQFKDINLQFPDDLTPDDKMKVQKLFLEIQKICPTCYDAGTNSNIVTTGPNKSGPVLFPTRTSIDTIVSISEFKALKRKAALCEN